MVGSAGMPLDSAELVCISISILSLIPFYLLMKQKTNRPTVPLTFISSPTKPSLNNISTDLANKTLSFLDTRAVVRWTRINKNSHQTFAWIVQALKVRYVAYTKEEATQYLQHCKGTNSWIRHLPVRCQKFESPKKWSSFFLKQNLPREYSLQKSIKHAHDNLYESEWQSLFNNLLKNQDQGKQAHNKYALKHFFQYSQGNVVILDTLLNILTRPQNFELLTHVLGLLRSGDLNRFNNQGEHIFRVFSRQIQQQAWSDTDWKNFFRHLSSCSLQNHVIFHLLRNSEAPLIDILFSWCIDPKNFSSFAQILSMFAPEDFYIANSKGQILLHLFIIKKNYNGCVLFIRSIAIANQWDKRCIARIMDIRDHKYRDALGHALHEDFLDNYLGALLNGLNLKDLEELKGFNVSDQNCWNGLISIAKAHHDQDIKIRKLREGIEKSREDQERIREDIEIIREGQERIREGQERIREGQERIQTLILE